MARGPMQPHRLHRVKAGPHLASELSNENSKLYTNEKSSYLTINTVPTAQLWASAQLWAVQRILLGRATLVVVGRVCCGDCVGSNIGYCNNCIL